MFSSFSSASPRSSSTSSNDNVDIDVEQGNLFASALGDNNNEEQLSGAATGDVVTSDDADGVEDGANDKANMEESLGVNSYDNSRMPWESSLGTTEAEAEGTVASGYSSTAVPSSEAVPGLPSSGSKNHNANAEGLRSIIPSATPEIVQDGEAPTPLTMLQDKNDVAPAAAAASAVATRTLHGVQLIDDNEGPAPPVTMMDMVSVDDNGMKRRVGGAKSSRVEQINDNNGPDEPFHLADIKEEVEDKKPPAVRSDENSAVHPTKMIPPTPLNLASIEDEVDDEKPPAFRPDYDEDSIIHPTREEIEDGSIQPYISPRAHNYLRARNDQGPNQDGDDGLVLSDPINVTYESADEIVNTRSDDEDEMERQQSAYIIPQAYAVGSGRLIEATPLEPQQPWWKQRKPRLLLGVFCVVLIVLSIALGISLSTVATSPEVMVNPIVSQPSLFPSFSVSPSVRFSDAPSSTMVPSFSPTACGEGIVYSSKKIDLQLVNPSNPKVAVDGENMVVVAKDSESSRYINVMFYTFKDNGWEILGVSVDPEEYTGIDYSVSISGKTAFLGLPDARNGAGEVLVYEESPTGVWQRSLDPIVFTDASSGFGSFIGVDGDLACICDHDSVSIFHRLHSDFHLPQDKWSHLKTTGNNKTNSCSVAGQHILLQSEGGDLLLYKYQRQYPFSAIPLQEPILAKVTSAALSTDYLVYLDDTSTIIYHQEEINQTFVLSQRLTHSVSANRNHISMDKDILAIGGGNHTSILTKHNGYWNEAIVLDRSFDRYEVTGRNLIAMVGNEVYYMNLKHCVQPTPTHAPTSSVIPTKSPCYGIDIVVVYDTYAHETSWKLEGINELGKSNEIATHEAIGGDNFQSMCLPEGEYYFTIYDSGRDGICCGDYGEGHYSITSSNGGLIAEGGEFGWSETTLFVLPFSPAPSSTPSISPTSLTSSPTSSLFPSITPSSSHSPSSFPSSIPSIPPSSSHYPSSSLFPSILPSSSSRPSMTHIRTPLFGSGGYSSKLTNVAIHGNNVAIHGDTAVVTSLVDVHFFAFINDNFDLVTKIDIDYYGGNVAMNDNMVVIGSPYENYDTGAIYMYEKDDNGIWKETMKIVPNDIQQDTTYFGISVAIDGNVIVVGTLENGKNKEGSVYVYRQDKGNWVQEAKLTPFDGSKVKSFGTYVSVKND